MGVSWSLAGGKEEDLAQFGASCTQLQKLLSVAARAQEEVRLPSDAWRKQCNHFFMMLEKQPLSAKVTTD